MINILSNKSRLQFIFLLTLVVVFGFMLGYILQGKVKANHLGFCNPQMYGRCVVHGYFTDNPGVPLPLFGVLHGDYETGIWTQPNDTARINAFIARIKSDLNQNPNGTYDQRRRSISAAFYVATMLRQQGSNFGSVNAGVNWARSLIDEWEDRVRAYHDNGWIDWYTGNFNGSEPTSGLQQEWSFGTPNIVDANWILNGANESRPSLRFNNPNGTEYTIKLYCGNVTGYVEGLENIDYDNRPSVGVPPDAKQGDTVFFDIIQVQNQGQANSPSGTEISLSYNPSGIPGDGVVWTGVINAGATINDTNGLPDSFNVPNNFPPGLLTVRLCVSPATSDINQRCDEDTILIIETTEPFFTAQGGDVWAGASFPDATDPEANPCEAPDSDGAIRTYFDSGNFFGSLTNFAAYAQGNIEEFGTAKEDPGNNDERLMAFANQPPASPAGNFGAERCITDYYSALDKSKSTGDIFTASEGQYFHSGNLSLNSGQINQSKTLIVSGNVTLNGNITYPGSYASTEPDDVPVFILIAKGDITIGKNVTELHGLYMSQYNDGKIVTCGVGGLSGLASDQDCNQQLTVRGTLVADNIYFTRSSGDYRDTNTNPAETFVFSPELYVGEVILSGAGEGGAAGQFDILDITDLPPVLAP